jgi:flagellar hook-associated protein 3 FlgL
MRITFNMMTRRVFDDLSTSSQRLVDAQIRASSGKRILKPSDDVTGTGKAIRLRSAISEIEQFTRNTDMAKSQMGVTENTLNTISKALQDVRTVAMRAANDSMTADNKTALAAQLDQIVQDLVAAANTQYSGKYILAGSQTQKQPIIVNAGGEPPYSYQGDSESFKVQIAPGGTYITANVTADAVFNMGSAAVASAPDAFSMIKTLKENVLAGDTQAISEQLSDIDAIWSNVSNIVTNVGARMQRLEAADNSLQDTKVVMSDLLSKTEDADLMEAVLEVRTRENIYQAAMTTANRLMEVTLANNIK